MRTRGKVWYITPSLPKFQYLWWFADGEQFFFLLIPYLLVSLYQWRRKEFTQIAFRRFFAAYSFGQTNDIATRSRWKVCNLVFIISNYQLRLLSTGLFCKQVRVCPSQRVYFGLESNNNAFLKTNSSSFFFAVCKLGVWTSCHELSAGRNWN